MRDKAVDWNSKWEKMWAYTFVNTAPIIKVLSGTVLAARFITFNSLGTCLGHKKRKEKEDGCIITA